jgi:hypothetical protein
MLCEVLPAWHPWQRSADLSVVCVWKAVGLRAAYMTQHRILPIYSTTNIVPRGFTHNLLKRKTRLHSWKYLIHQNSWSLLHLNFTGIPVFF